MAGYLTVTEFRERLGNVSTSDPLLTSYIDAASRQIDGWCGRSFERVLAVNRTFTAWNGFVEIGDALTITSVVAGDSTSITDYTTHTSTYGGVTLRSAYFIYGDTITVMGDWGYAAPPAQIKEATAIQAMRLWKRKDAPFGIVGSQEFGTLRALGNMDPDVAALIAPYQVASVGVI